MKPSLNRRRHRHHHLIIIIPTIVAVVAAAIVVVIIIIIVVVVITILLLRSLARASSVLYVDNGEPRLAWRYAGRLAFVPFRPRFAFLSLPK